MEALLSARAFERNADAGHPAGARHRLWLRYLVVTAVGNLAWELLQMPLYTIWRSGTWSEVIFAAVHCTGGDILIALSCLVVGRSVVGPKGRPGRSFAAVMAVTIALGIVATTFFEWLNVVVRAAWAYSNLMPVLSVFGFQIGVSPLLQWVVVPVAAFTWAYHGSLRRRFAASFSAVDAVRPSRASLGPSGPSMCLRPDEGDSVGW